MLRLNCFWLRVERDYAEIKLLLAKRGIMLRLNCFWLRVERDYAEIKLLLAKSREGLC